jgi:DNA repair exonuclease SbcCD ATPase subunit
LDSRAVEELRALAARDRELEEGASSLRSLDAAVAEVRERAEAIADFFARHGEEDDRLRQLEAREAAAIERRRAELDEARSTAQKARTDEERTLATKRIARAADHVELAERALEAAHAEHRAFDDEAEQLTRELPELEARARSMGAEEDDLVDWASRRHAELFVALGQVDAERERVIREANELATSLLGEPTFGSTAAQALERVKSSFALPPGKALE